MSLIKSVLRALLSVFAPFLLIGAGAGISSLGLTYDYKILIWTGLILMAVGIFWGIVIFLYYAGGD